MNLSMCVCVCMMQLDAWSWRQQKGWLLVPSAPGWSGSSVHPSFCYPPHRSVACTRQYTPSAFYVCACLLPLITPCHVEVTGIFLCMPDLTCFLCYISACLQGLLCLCSDCCTLASKLACMSMLDHLRSLVLAMLTAIHKYRVLAQHAIIACQDMLACRWHILLQ